jgi:divalent metal cation (Fe/Co/Zn/Cd) transporter
VLADCMKLRHAAALAPEGRSAQLRAGARLEAITVLWNIAEGIIAIAAATMAGSIALVAFGIDSFVETASGAIVGWRLLDEISQRAESRAEQTEKLAARITGILLLTLAVYIAVASSAGLLKMSAKPQESPMGVAVTAASLVVMPILGRAKLRCASAIESSALRADAYETIACAWLSGTALLGLGANALFGWWWADPIAALALIPLIVREGLEGLSGGSEHDHAGAA